MKRLGILALALALALLAGDLAWRAGFPASQAHDWSTWERDLAQLGARTTLLEATWLALDPARVDVIIIADGGRAPSAEERDALASFVAAGGRALILGEPHAARVLGVEILATPISAATTLPGARPVFGDGEVIAMSGAASHLDVDGDGRAGPGDVAGPFTIAIAARDGRAIVVGASSLDTAPELRDEMVGRLGIAEGRVALDTSRDTEHRARDALLALGVDVAERAWLRVALAALLLSGAGALVYAYRPRRREASSDGADAVVRLQEARP